MQSSTPSLLGMMDGSCLSSRLCEGALKRHRICSLIMVAMKLRDNQDETGCVARRFMAHAGKGEVQLQHDVKEVLQLWATRLTHRVEWLKVLSYVYSNFVVGVIRY